jgi:hypothetical protein
MTDGKTSPPATPYVQIYKQPTSRLSNKVVTVASSYITASFTRPLVVAAPNDTTILVDGSRQRLVFAIHPTTAGNGRPRHPRGTIVGIEENAGVKTIAFGSASSCVDMIAAGSFAAGSGDFRVTWRLLSSNVIEFSMEADTLGWISMYVKCCSKRLSIFQQFCRSTRR